MKKFILTLFVRENRVNEWSRTGEFLIDTNIVYVPTPGWQYSPFAKNL
ncbi:MAG: hypothetical protein ABIK97_06940 [candidate division WOR-3 bacterium]